MVRIVAEFVLAGIFLILAVVTAITPRWIEAVFNVDPDRGSGVLEWIIVAAFGVLALVAGGLGTRTAIMRGRAADA